MKTLKEEEYRKNSDLISTIMKTDSYLNGESLMHIGEPVRKPR